MASKIDSKQANANITSHESLVTRLDLNKRYGRFDFHGWIAEQYKIGRGMDVLDVGCGNGAQALKALESVGAEGSVSAVDLSADSVAELRNTGRKNINLQAEVGDMGDLGSIIRDKFRVKQYDLAHATYSLAYASNPLDVLDAMRLALKPSGRLIVTTPNDPNSLRELAKRLGRRVPRLDQIGRFPANVLEPYFRTYFYSVTVHMRKNVLRIPTAEEVVRFFRSTAYFDAELEEGVSRFAELEIKLRGFFAFEKNNYMIIGEQPQ